MANKYYRQNLRNGTNPTKRKSNIAKIMETFGPKKKVKKTKKRMFANKGGGADMGEMGEMKSKLAIAGMKAKEVLGKSTGGLTKKQIEKLKEIMERRKNKKRNEMTPLNKGGRAALKKGSKFPDHSGDGKITQKDILMAKGVIPKKKNNKKVI